MSRWLFFLLCVTTVAALRLRPAERPQNGAQLGAPCEDSLQCQYGLSCVGGDGPLAGQCAARCSSDASCQDRFGSQTLCIAVDQCAIACQSDADCSGGTACNTYGFCEIDQKLDD